eukprot:CAMPEP_0172502452 /NCGR_PEP_ID=MMETSP1066-20121228/160161_1 /TAXON_ID=671091 /ORGANISM="Coscinodiscus wailesii, Strain CCMP2513" /LENGTH=257 /DNA_ID=CAMNT_0013277711 /DNA_START=21 /DNA_END=794 /DNA_ORIENTATION=+
MTVLRELTAIASSAAYLLALLDNQSNAAFLPTQFATTSHRPAAARDGVSTKIDELTARFRTYQKPNNARIAPRRWHASSPSSSSSNSNDDEDDDDATSRQQQPSSYGNRSLAWTERYRRTIPYEKARIKAMSLGLRSKADWDDYLADGKKIHGPYLPNRPDEMYPDDWISWEEFLGVMRPYDEARDLVVTVLGLTCMDEYEAFVGDDVKRAEGLRIPAKPHKVYKGKGWRGFDHFFGKEESTLYFSLDADTDSLPDS